MAGEIPAIIGMGIAPLGVLGPLLLSLRGEVAQVRRDLHSLAEFVARIEGALFDRLALNENLKA